MFEIYLYQNKINIRDGAEFFSEENLEQFTKTFKKFMRKHMKQNANQNMLGGGNYEDNRRDVIEVLNYCLEMRHDFGSGLRADRSVRDIVNNIKCDNTDDYIKLAKKFEPNDTFPDLTSFANFKYPLEKVLASNNMETMFFLNVFLNTEYYDQVINLSENYDIFAYDFNNRGGQPTFYKTSIIGDRIENPIHKYGVLSLNSITPELVGNNIIYSTNEFVKYLRNKLCGTSCYENILIDTIPLGLDKVLKELLNNTSTSTDQSDSFSPVQNIRSIQTFTKEWDPATLHGEFDDTIGKINNTTNNIFDYNFSKDYVNYTFKGITKFLIKIENKENAIISSNDQIRFYVRTNIVGATQWEEIPEIRNGFSVQELSSGIMFLNDILHKGTSSVKVIAPLSKLIDKLLKFKDLMGEYLKVKDLYDELTDDTYTRLLILVLLDLKKSGDWGLVRHCKEKGMILFTMDRLCALYAILNDVNCIFSGKFSITDTSTTAYIIIYTKNDQHILSGINNKFKNLLDDAIKTCNNTCKTLDDPFILNTNNSVIGDITLDDDVSRDSLEVVNDSTITGGADSTVRRNDNNILKHPCSISFLESTTISLINRFKDFLNVITYKLHEDIQPLYNDICNQLIKNIEDDRYLLGLLDKQLEISLTSSKININERLIDIELTDLEATSDIYLDMINLIVLSKMLYISYVTCIELEPNKLYNTFFTKTFKNLYEINANIRYTRSKIDKSNPAKMDEFRNKINSEQYFFVSSSRNKKSISNKELDDNLIKSFNNIDNAKANIRKILALMNDFTIYNKLSLVLNTLPYVYHYMENTFRSTKFNTVDMSLYNTLKTKYQELAYRSFAFDVSELVNHGDDPHQSPQLPTVITSELGNLHKIFSKYKELLKQDDIASISQDDKIISEIKQSTDGFRECILKILDYKLTDQLRLVEYLKSNSVNYNGKYSENQQILLSYLETDFLKIFYDKFCGENINKDTHKVIKSINEVFRVVFEKYHTKILEDSKKINNNFFYRKGETPISNKLPPKVPKYILANRVLFYFIYIYDYQDTQHQKTIVSEPYETLHKLFTNILNLRDAFRPIVNISVTNNVEIIKAIVRIIMLMLPTRIGDDNSISNYIYEDISYVNLSTTTESIYIDSVLLKFTTLQNTLTEIMKIVASDKSYNSTTFPKVETDTSIILPSHYTLFLDLEELINVPDTAENASIIIDNICDILILWNIYVYLHNDRTHTKYTYTHRVNKDVINRRLNTNSGKKLINYSEIAELSPMELYDIDTITWLFNKKIEQINSSSISNKDTELTRIKLRIDTLKSELSIKISKNIYILLKNYTSNVKTSLSDKDLLDLFYKKGLNCNSMRQSIIDISNGENYCNRLEELNLCSSDNYSKVNVDKNCQNVNPTFLEKYNNWLSDLKPSLDEISLARYKQIPNTKHNELVNAYINSKYQKTVKVNTDKNREQFTDEYICHYYKNGLNIDDYYIPDDNHLKRCKCYSKKPLNIKGTNLILPNCYDTPKLVDKMILTSRTTSSKDEVEEVSPSSYRMVSSKDKVEEVSPSSYRMVSSKDEVEEVSPATSKTASLDSNIKDDLNIFADNCFKCSSKLPSRFNTVCSGDRKRNRFSDLMITNYKDYIDSEICQKLKKCDSRKAQKPLSGLHNHCK